MVRSSFHSESKLSELPERQGLLTNPAFDWTSASGARKTAVRYAAYCRTPLVVVTQLAH